MHGKRYTTNKARVEVLKMLKGNPNYTRGDIAEATGIPYAVVSAWVNNYRSRGQAIYKKGEPVLQWVVDNSKAVLEIESTEEGYRLSEIEEYLKEKQGMFSDPIHPEGVVCKTMIPGGKIFFFGSTTIDEQNRIITECLSLSDQSESHRAQEVFDV